jgi:SAM-dependent methyltransferase
MVDAGQFAEALSIYPTVSESYWRGLELARLREVRRSEAFDSPILEIGCGDGRLGARVFPRIDLGVDINPRAVERARASGAYRRVECIDACRLPPAASTYRTVFANCVLEHISPLQEVLAAAAGQLQPGGKLLATVPLRAMNEHLAVPVPRYAELRRRQLVHVNLLDLDGWVAALRRAGFSDVRSVPYLRGEDIRLWDRIDFPMCVGVGRYRVSTALGLLARGVPHRWRSLAHEQVGRWLAARAAAPRVLPACAVVLVATKGLADRAAPGRA